MDLVIGIGNELRGDDAVGPRLVDDVEPANGLETMSVHQLTPEMADRLSRVNRVLFVDAAVDRGEVCLERIEPAQTRGIGHAVSPGALLGWTQFAFGRRPEAWLLAVPAGSFGVGDPISPEVSGLLPEAKEKMNAWLSFGRDRSECMGSDEGEVGGATWRSTPRPRSTCSTCCTTCRRPNRGTT